MYQKLTLALTTAYLWSPLAALASQHTTPKGQVCSGLSAVGGGCNSGTGLGGFLGNIANLLIFIVGAISVLMIIVGGLRYVLSAGDPQSVKAAKDTVLYAIVGVVVAILAFAMVRFVTNAVNPTPAGAASAITLMVK